MPEADEDISFEELRKSFVFLNDLPLMDVYSVFALKEYYEEYHGQYCTPYSNGSGPDVCNLHDLCLRIYNILSMLNQMLNVHYIDDQIKLSEHLSYWIYDSTKNSKTCDKLEQLYDDLKKYKSHYFPKDKSNVQDFSTTGDGFIKKKSLFLHGDILHWIVNSKEKIDGKQSTSYHKYLGECFKFYKKIKCNDNPETKYEYSDELNTFESNFNIAISTLKEKGVKITKEKITLPDASICNMEWENVEERAELQDAIEGAITEDTGSIYTGKKEPVSSIGGPQGKDADKGEILPSEPQESAGLASLASIDLNGAGNIREPSETIMPKNVGTIGASVAGSSLFLLMMYKYTPLGSWVSTKILRKDRLMDNMRKNNYELLLNELDNREMSLNDTMYHIRYNSATNQ